VVPWLVYPESGCCPRADTAAGRLVWSQQQRGRPLLAARSRSRAWGRLLLRGLEPESACASNGRL